MKKTLCFVLAFMLLIGMVGAVSAEAPELPTYTYNTYTTSLASDWNPHTWQTSAESNLLELYLTSPIVTMVPKDTEEGVYQWAFGMTTAINDVTADHIDDLTKYGVDLGGKEASEITEGYVYEFVLNEKACWQDGTPINADTYIYSMKAMLDPAMKNYRANNYYSGDSTIAGAEAYYFAGSMSYKDENGGDAPVFTFADLTKGDDGAYYTADGYPVYFALNVALAWLQGNTLKDYVDAYGDQYFGVDTWESLVALMNDDGVVPLTDESYELFKPVITANANWGETEDNMPCYMVYGVEMPIVDFDVVGVYKVDDYKINVVYQNSMPSYEECLYYNSGWPWLVYEPIYEANKDTTGKLVTTKYNNSVENTMSYGPYKLESLQEDKQMVFVRNENWYGWEKAEDGSLISYTDYEVNGEKQQRYQATKVVIDVMTDDAAKQAFLKGDLDDWAPPAEELVTYAASDRLYKADETYTMSFFFHTKLDDLKTMDESKGNTNSVVLSNENFRKAFSFSIDRAEWVTATPGYTPMFGILNNLYYYNFFKDPSSTYRSSDAAMQAVTDIYGVEYGEGTPYETLKDAYKSINGYNLTMAKELMAQACKELVEAGIYTEGEEIKIRVAYKKGALDSTDNKQIELMNKYINAAAEGSGFGKITLEAVGNINNRYDDTANGEFAIGYGAWGGAALVPFTMFRVYCDDDYVTPINEAGCWDPATEELTLNIEGEDVTMTWKEWSNSMSGTGKYAKADATVKLQVLAGLEKNFLMKYYRIPLATSTACSLLSFKTNYITEDYNFAYGWGGFELMSFNYNDAEWADFIASQNGALNYE